MYLLCKWISLQQSGCRLIVLFNVVIFWHDLICCPERRNACALLQLPPDMYKSMRPKHLGLSCNCAECWGKVENNRAGALYLKLCRKMLANAQNQSCAKLCAKMKSSPFPWEENAKA